jgi:hypothetical protein
MAELAEIILTNLDDWWAEVRTMEPRSSRSVVKLAVARTTGGNVVEAFALRRDTWLRILRRFRGVIRRLPPYLRQVHRLKYKLGMTRDEISGSAHIHVRTVDKRLGIIRGRMEGCLYSLRDADREELERLIGLMRPPDAEDRFALRKIARKAKKRERSIPS